MKTEHTTITRIAILAFLLAGGARAEWQLSGAYTTNNGGTATDGNWDLKVTTVTIGDATGLTIAQCRAGEGDLDLTTFYDDTGWRVIKVDSNVLRYPDSGNYFPGVPDDQKGKLMSFTGPDVIWLGQVQCADVTNVCVPQCTYLQTGISGASLERVQISGAITNIGQRAFQGSPALRSIEPSEWPLLETVGDGLFSGCGSLEGEFLLGRVTALKGGTFNGCGRITGVTAPLCTSIGQSDFYNCSNLEYAVFSPEISKIGDTAFYQCASLRTFAPAALPRLATMGRQAFRKCKALETVFVFSCSDLTSLPGNAFAECNALREVHFRSPIKSVDSGAFSVAPCAEFHFYSDETPTSLGMAPVVNTDPCRLRVILHDGVDFDTWATKYTPVANLKATDTNRADFPGKRTLGLTKGGQWVIDGRGNKATVILVQ